MLDKNKGCIFVEKLREIILMEADFNMLKKMFIGSKIPKKDETMKEIPTENEGGRKDCSTDEFVL